MWLLKKFAAFIITFIVLGLALIAFFLYFNSLSIPESFEEIRFIGLSDEVRVLQNTTGIKHIIAKNEPDAYFMIGYIQARDRLFQMDIRRRTAKGELAEIYGRDYIIRDKYLRSLNIRRIVDSALPIIDYRTVRLLQKYSDGINAYIKENLKKLPFGFSTLDYKPYLWTVNDCIAIHKLFAYEQSVAFKSDLIFGSIAEKTGIDKAMELLPEDSVNMYPIYDGNENEHKAKSQKLNAKSKRKTALTVNGQLLINNKKNKWGISDYCRLLKDNDLFFDGAPGCNAWAVKKTPSFASGAVVANDFHSTLNVPAMWYEIHASYPGVNLIGLSLPGLPFVLSGRNSYIGWGLANSMIDDCDFFIEKVDKTLNYYTSADSSMKKFDFQKDTIKVKNQEDHIYYLRFTNRSPVISDFHIPFTDIFCDKLTNILPVMTKYVITYSWTGSYKSDELTTLYRLTRAKNWHDFSKSFRAWVAPSFNFVYGDKNGNIGLLTAGALPIRNEKNNMVMPNPGWLNEYSWSRLLKFGIIDSVYNPAKHFTSAANNALGRNTNYSKYFDIYSRSQRIAGLINQYHETSNYVYSNVDAQRMQLDLLSEYAKEMCAQIYPIIDTNSHTLTAHEKEVYKLLRYWDYISSPEKRAPAIFNMFMKNLIENIFIDELGNTGFKYYVTNLSYAYGKTLELMKERMSPWFDDVRTSHVETRTFIVIISFKQAVASLEKLYNSNDVKIWQYGSVHNVKFSSNLKKYEFLQPVSSFPGLSRGGDNTTLNYTAWDYFEPFNVSSSSSMRMIADMADDLVYLSIPGGVSEEPMSPNYSSQLHLWENGGYVQVPMHSTENDEWQLIIKGR